MMDKFPIPLEATNKIAVLLQFSYRLPLNVMKGVLKFYAVFLIKYFRTKK